MELNLPERRSTFPALRCVMGSWIYYITYMKFSDVAHWIKPTDQIHKSPMLRDMIQRELNPRASAITEYIISQDERFFNSLVIGVYDGAPQWYPIEVNSDFRSDSPDLDEDGRNSIGLLRLEGQENLFAIDGQHRVKAIKDALMIEPERATEDISVILVAHSTTVAGQERTRRLFTTLNKWAKRVSKSETIALDEDDAFAVVTRRLVEDFPLLQSPSRYETRYITFGAQPSLHPDDKVNLTTIRTIYEISRIIYLPLLTTSVHKEQRKKNKELTLRRPNDEVLDSIYSESTQYWTLLTEYLPEYQELFHSEPSEEVAGKYREAGGHFMFRPVGQQAFARGVRVMMDRGVRMESAIEELVKVPMDLSKPPWVHVLWDPYTNRILKKASNEFFESMLLYLVGQPLRRKGYRLPQLYRDYLGDADATLPTPVTGTLL